MADCVLCGGIGLIRTDKGSRSCDCQAERRQHIQLAKAGIPPKFQRATLANFTTTATTARAVTMARRFVHEFIPGTDENIPGLLLSGTVGTGKTHLATAIMRELILTKGIVGRFVDIRELLDQLRSSYDEHNQQTQAGIMRPIKAADLVVIDELGAVRPSDWVFDTMELLIGGLYNGRRTVIVTTNLPFLGPGATQDSESGYAARQARPETLGDRVGARIWSRLRDMCIAVDMSGPDWRGKH